MIYEVFRTVPGMDTYSTYHDRYTLSKLNKKEAGLGVKRLDSPGRRGRRSGSEKFCWGEGGVGEQAGLGLYMS